MHWLGSLNPVVRSPAFRRLWVSSVFNALSMGGDFVLVSWLAYSVTGDAGWTGLAFALLFVPMFFLGVPAGTLADRYNRHGLLRTLELAAGAALLLLALAFTLSSPGLVHVLIMPLALGCIRSVQNPVRLSFAFDLAGANNAMGGLAGVSLATRAGTIVGALSAGTLAQAHGISGALAVMAVAHGAAWFCLGRSAPATSAQVLDRKPLMENLRESVTELKRNQLLLALVLVTAVVEVFGTSFSTLVPSLNDDRLGLGAQGLGWLFAAQATGALIAGIILFSIPARSREVFGYAAVIAGLGFMIVVLAWADGLVVMLVVLGLIAAAISAWDILTQSMMQLSVPEHLRGRAMGAWGFAIGSAPIGHLQIGLLAGAIGTEWALIGNGTLVVVTITVALLISPSLRRL
jgi:MFS family permease